MYIPILQAIGAFQYRAVIISPEQIMKPNSDFETLLKDQLFTSQIISIVIDEAHCVADWEDFRPEYNELRCLRYTLLTTVPIMIASATLSKETLTGLC